VKFISSGYLGIQEGESPDSNPKAELYLSIDGEFLPSFTGIISMQNKN
jgi:hypothetical protein